MSIDVLFFFFSSRRRHTRYWRDWISDVCSSDLHLVFAPLHTQDPAQTIDRIIDVFPPHQQQQVRVQLAGALQGVVAQQLCRTADGRGRVVTAEVLVATPAIRNLIREGKTHQIYSAMQAGAKDRKSVV